MNIDLSRQELETLEQWYAVVSDQTGTREADDTLYHRLSEVLEEARELDEMDLDDCLGGACKL